MKSLYFIAIIPPEQICDEITEFKLHVASEYESKAALRTVPHITLIAPFSISSEKHQELLQKFQDLTFNQEPFEMHLKDFGAFKNNKRPVIFVKPLPSEELRKLQFEMRSHMIPISSVEPSGNERDYDPHVTIAFKDLSRENFKKAWEVYSEQKYESKFVVDAVHLLHHNGNKWNVAASSKLL
ncbi:MAG TPA: RNA 2',3'-cyclic phosphodiesterase [Flavobacterium sp.]|jgi:2'-5' RNA ligase